MYVSIKSKSISKCKMEKKQYIYIYIYADAFIQSNLQCIQVIPVV